MLKKWQRFGRRNKKTNRVKAEDLTVYDLLGFGSGIYALGHHTEILKIAKKLPDMQGRPAFIFFNQRSKKQELNIIKLFAKFRKEKLLDFRQI